GVGHDVDLRRHRIGPPDDDAVTLGHFLRIRPSENAGAGEEPRPGRAGADGVVLQGIAARVAQPLDAVALYVPHGASIKIGPDRLRPLLPLDLQPAGDDLVERLVPADTLPLAGALFANATKRIKQAARVMNPLGVASHLLADHASGVRVILGAADA